MGGIVMWSQAGLCFRCGKPLLQEVKEGERFKRVVLVDTVDGRLGICCQECVRPGDRVM